MNRVNLIPSDYNKENRQKRRNILRTITGVFWVIVVFLIWQATAIFRYQFLIAQQKKELKPGALMQTA